MEKNKSTIYFADSILLFGLGIAVLYWVLVSVLQLFQYSGSNFMEQFMGKDTHDLYERFVVICLFIIFGSHARFNIISRKKAEDSLKESEEKYRNILESIEEGYYELDNKGVFTFFNDSMSRILEKSNSKLKGLHIRDFVDKGDTDNILSYLQENERKSDRISNTFDCEFITQKGNNKIIELSVSNIKDSKGHHTGFRGICRDVTERKILEKNLLASYREAQDTRTGTILGLAKLAEFRDSDTGQHLERIREYTKLIAENMAKKPKYIDYITEEYIGDIYLSSILHDIGKVGVSDNILLKPGKLTPEEFEVIKTHSKLGGDALNAVDSHVKGRSFLTIGKEIAYYHHERWDGHGYPKGLSGEDIPLSARKVALADVYDALTSKRCYKEAYSHEKAKNIIVEESGKHFDPEVVEAFLECEQDFIRIREEMNN